jgi:hypothetical protein
VRGPARAIAEGRVRDGEDGEDGEDGAGWGRMGQDGRDGRIGMEAAEGITPEKVFGALCVEQLKIAANQRMANAWPQNEASRCSCISFSRRKSANAPDARPARSTEREPAARCCSVGWKTAGRTAGPTALTEGCLRRETERRRRGSRPTAPKRPAHSCISASHRPAAVRVRTMYVCAGSEAAVGAGPGLSPVV